LPDHLALRVDVIIEPAVVLVFNGIHDGVLLGVEVFMSCEQTVSRFCLNYANICGAFF
jgi:hypothetical protein